MAFSSPYRSDCFIFCVQLFCSIQCLCCICPFNWSQAPSSFPPPFIKPTSVSFPVYTSFISFCFLSVFRTSSNLQLITSELCLTAGTGDAPVAVIVFLVFSSEFGVILNVPVFRLFRLSFTYWRIKASLSSVLGHLHVLSCSALVFLSWRKSSHFCLSTNFPLFSTIFVHLSIPNSILIITLFAHVNLFPPLFHRSSSNLPSTASLLLQSLSYLLLHCVKPYQQLCEDDKLM